MKKPKRPTPAKVDTALGVWSSFRALTAPADKALPQRDLDRIITRLERAYAALTTAPEPPIAAWRDCADVVNFLQSLLELEWATDEGGHIEAGKLALKQASDSLQHHGKLRLTGQSISAVRECLDRFAELAGQMSERSYWQAVRHTHARINALLTGRSRPGDIVVAL
jgi:hypothetical protein